MSRDGPNLMKRIVILSLGPVSREVSLSNIDRVCQLIHELKEQDLQSHKERIMAEQVCFRHSLVCFFV